VAAMAAATVVLKRARVSLARRGSLLYTHSVPDEKLWIESFEAEMLMLDG
jgi:hypothetical protein